MVFWRFFFGHFHGNFSIVITAGYWNFCSVYLRAGLVTILFSWSPVWSQHTEVSSTFSDQTANLNRRVCCYFSACRFLSDSTQYLYRLLPLLIAISIATNSKWYPTTAASTLLQVLLLVDEESPFPREFYATCYFLSCLALRLLLKRTPPPPPQPPPPPPPRPTL